MKRPRAKNPPVPIPAQIEDDVAYLMSLPPAPRVDAKEYVYLTKTSFGYKIGRTSQPERRPLTVAGNMPIQLDVIAVIEVPDSREAEKQLHGHFHGKRLRGEWFALSQEDVELIKGFPASFDGLLRGDDIPF